MNQETITASSSIEDSKCEKARGRDGITTKEKLKWL